jgi:putative intracellular protease/amidase
MKRVYLFFMLVFVLVLTGYASAQERGSNVLIVLRESGESADEASLQTQETAEITRLLEGAGYQPVLASASGRTFMGGTPPVSYKTLKLAKVKVSDYEAFIFTSGDRESLYKERENATPGAITIVQQAVAEGKLVAAQRYGIVVLAEAGVLIRKEIRLSKESQRGCTIR